MVGAHMSFPAPKANPPLSWLQPCLPATRPSPLPRSQTAEHKVWELREQGNGLFWVFSKQQHKKPITRIFKLKVLVPGGGGRHKRFPSLIIAIGLYIQM